MPGFNRTGPQGTGPLTGGGRGPCCARSAGYGGRRVDVGLGSGRGYRRRYTDDPAAGRSRGYGRRDSASQEVATAGSADELSLLKAEAERARNEFETIARRIDDLEKRL